MTNRACAPRHARGAPGRRRGSSPDLAAAAPGRPRQCGRARRPRASSLPTPAALPPPTARHRDPGQRRTPPRSPCSARCSRRGMRARAGSECRRRRARPRGEADRSTSSVPTAAPWLRGASSSASRSLRPLRSARLDPSGLPCEPAATSLQRMGRRRNPRRHADLGAAQRPQPHLHGLGERRRQLVVYQFRLDRLLTRW